MNDIYYKKAKKYKYKYLKLKREYIAKGGVWGLKNLSSCIARPPVLFSTNSLNELQIKRDYPMTSTSDSKSLINEFNNINHIGRLLSYNDYQKELANFKSLNPPPNFFFNPTMEQYIRIKFACLISKEKRVVQVQVPQIVSGTYKAMILPDNHLKQTFPKCSVIGSADSYGYIISNTSKSFSQLYLNSQFSKPIISSFKIAHASILLNKLIEAIENFLIPLHNQGYVLDFDWDKKINWNTRSYLDENYYENIYWDEINRKIYFNILKIKKDNLKQYIYKDIKGLIYYIYKFYTLILTNLNLNSNLNPLIIRLDKFLSKDTKVTSEELIEEIKIIINSLETTIKNSQDKQMHFALKQLKLLDS